MNQLSGGEWVQLFLGVCVLLGTVYGARATRRSAKDNVGFQYLVQAATEQRTQLTEVRTELTGVKERLTAQETETATLKRQNADHRPWDDRIYSQARAAGWDVPPPPPLG